MDDPYPLPRLALRHHEISQPRITGLSPLARGQTLTAGFSFYIQGLQDITTCTGGLR